MSIRPMSLEDIPSILDLEINVWGKAITDPYDLTLYIMSGLAFVYTLDNQIVGYLLAIKGVPENRYQIAALGVGFDFRNRGIGKELYLMLFDLIPGSEIYSLVSESNDSSKHLHEKLGFKKEIVLSLLGDLAGLWIKK